MKTTITIAIVALLGLSSCKKNVECRCTTELYTSGKPTQTTISYETYYNTTPKKAMDGPCSNSKIVIPYTIDTITQVNNGTTKRTCELH